MGITEWLFGDNTDDADTSYQDGNIKSVPVEDRVARAIYAEWELPEKKDVIGKQEGENGAVIELDEPRIAYKRLKARKKMTFDKDRIAVLVVPEGATVVYAGNKIRVDEAYVDRIVNVEKGTGFHEYVEGMTTEDSASSPHADITYTAGNMHHVVGGVDEDTFQTCNTDGIYVYRDFDHAADIVY